MKRRFVVLAITSTAVIVFAVVLTRVGSSSATPAQGQPMQYAPQSSTSPVPISPEAALWSALASLNSNVIVRASLGAAPTGSTDKTIPWFYATVAAPSLSGGADIEPLWEADLVQGAIAELSGSGNDLRDSIGGSTLDVSLPTGTVVNDVSGGMGDVIRGQMFEDPSNAELAKTVRSVLSQYGLNLVSLKTLKAPTSAPEIVASTSDPAATAGQLGALATTLFGVNPTRFVGYYLMIRDSAGVTRIVTSSEFRTGAARLWIDPALTSDLGGVREGARPSRTR